MKRYEMIKDKERFNYIIRKGHYNKDKYYVVYHVPASEDRGSRFGIAVKKSLGCAVERNRVKRQTRSIVDNNKNLFKKNRDYIIMIRNECVGGKFSDMSESLVTLLKGIK